MKKNTNNVIRKESITFELQEKESGLNGGELSYLRTEFNLWRVCNAVTIRLVQKIEFLYSIDPPGRRVCSGCTIFFCFNVATQPGGSLYTYT